MSIIKDIWNGNIDPMEAGIFDTPQIREMARELIEIRGKLESGMSNEQKECLEQYSECRSIQESLLYEIAFDCGFKLGAKIIAEALLSNHADKSNTISERYQ